MTSQDLSASNTRDPNSPSYSCLSRSPSISSQRYQLSGLRCTASRAQYRMRLTNVEGFVLIRQHNGGKQYFLSFMFMTPFLRVRSYWTFPRRCSTPQLYSGTNSIRLTTRTCSTVSKRTIALLDWPCIMHFLLSFYNNFPSLHRLYRIL